MATVSAFGFGGTDHLNTLFENSASAHYARDMARWNARQQREMSEWQWKNEPKLRRQGLEDAGLNPLLAVGSLGGSSALGASEAAAPVWDGGDTNLGSYDDWQFGKRKENATSALDASTAQNRADESIAEVDRIKADIEREALEDFQADVYDEKGNLKNPTRYHLREAFRNGVHTKEYESNWIRSLLGDVLGFGSEASSAFGNAASGSSALRNSKRPVVVPKGARILKKW